MSIADIAASAQIVRTDAKVVTLDIERLPGRATVQHRGLTISGDFWDLSGWKHVIGRRIHADDVTEWPRTISVAWKHYGKPKVQFAAEWDDGGAEGMLQAAWDVYDHADILVGHNIDSFDSARLRGGWTLLGLPLPSPAKSVDTLKVARAQLGLESNTLDSLCKRFGIPAKSDKYDVATARAACDGDKAAQRKLRLYNCGDVTANEGLYDRLRGRIPNHPHLGSLNADEHRCNQCGSTDLERNGTYLAVQIRYTQWRCQNCGANLRSAQHSRAANMRGAR